MTSYVYIFLISIAFFAKSSISNDCLPRDYGYNGTVCVCSLNSCDTLPHLEIPKSGEYVVYTTNKEGKRFDKNNGRIKNVFSEETNTLKIEEEVTLQEILGFGGAFTDAAGININSLTDDLQEQLMNSYFSKDGLEYSLCRVPIGGTDFSTHGYSYCDTTDPDIELKNFALQLEDYKYKIPYILWAKNITEGNLKLIASAWSAPKWMKLNGSYNGTFGFLKQAMYQSWANYHLKFLEHYQNQGIRFWGITTGNEPIQGFFTLINSVAWFPWDMSRYIRENFGPTLRNSNFSDINIMMLDDQRFFLPWYPEWVLDNEETANYIDGIAVHWYFDDKFTPELNNVMHESHPEKFMLMTEACNGDHIGEEHVMLGNWERGEKYASSIIEHLNTWSTGWIDWNIALNTEGGPTYVNNNVDSPIIVNTTSNEFYKQPMYYVMGHFSKFIPRGSYKINSTQVDKDVPVSAFKRPDGGIVVVALNKKETEVPVSISTARQGIIELVLSAKSVSTVVYYN